MAIGQQPIYIVGCGPGSRDYLTPVALKAIEEAEVLVGASRLLELFPSTRAERVAVRSDTDETLDFVASRADSQRIAVLVSGDPGLFSLAKLVIKRFGRSRCKVIPGVSSVQTAFARIGVDWADAHIISIHKQYPANEPELADADKIAILCGREGSTGWIADHLLQDNLTTCRVFICQNLTMENEQVREVDPCDLAALAVPPSSIVLIVKGSVF